MELIPIKEKFEENEALYFIRSVFTCENSYSLDVSRSKKEFLLKNYCISCSLLKLISYAYYK
jgi:hypothetical protein